MAYFQFCAEIALTDASHNNFHGIISTIENGVKEQWSYIKEAPKPTSRQRQPDDHIFQMDDDFVLKPKQALP
jgi:hypothetical protein